MENMWCIYFFTLKRHMTPLGKKELSKIYMIWTSGDVDPILFKTFYSKENFRVRVGKMDKLSASGCQHGYQLLGFPSIAGEPGGFYHKYLPRACITSPGSTR